MNNLFKLSVAGVSLLVSTSVLATSINTGNQLGFDAQLSNRSSNTNVNDSSANSNIDAQFSNNGTNYNSNDSSASAIGLTENDLTNTQGQQQSANNRNSVDTRDTNIVDSRGGDAVQHQGQGQGQHQSSKTGDVSTSSDDDVDISIRENHKRAPVNTSGPTFSSKAGSVGSMTGREGSASYAEIYKLGEYSDATELNIRAYEWLDSVKGAYADSTGTPDKVVKKRCWHSRNTGEQCETIVEGSPSTYEMIEAAQLEQIQAVISMASDVADIAPRGKNIGAVTDRVGKVLMLDKVLPALGGASQVKYLVK